jgi:hypothetical protein
MGKWGTSCRRAALVAGVAAVCAAGLVAPASADDGVDLPPDSDDWGTVIAGNKSCVQADSWIARVTGLGRMVNTAMFESHYPTMAEAPEEQGGGRDIVDLTAGGFGIGKVSALYTRSLGHRIPVDIGGGSTRDVPCGAYAQAGGGSVDVGIPYVANPFGATPMSPFGVHVDAVDVSATSEPGQPVKFRGGAASGYFSMFGQRIIDIPKIWPVNFGVRIPQDRSQPVLALAETNEQVTTDRLGRPTLDSSGHYFTDPSATSGYVNAIHASVLGGNAADVTVGHAAVLRDPANSEAPPCAVPNARCARPGK